MGIKTEAQSRKSDRVGGDKTQENKKLYGSGKINVKEENC